MRGKKEFRPTLRPSAEAEMIESKVFRPTLRPSAEAEMMESKVFRPTLYPSAEAETMESKVFRPTLRPLSAPAAQLKLPNIKETRTTGHSDNRSIMKKRELAAFGPAGRIL